MIDMDMAQNDSILPNQLLDLTARILKETCVDFVSAKKINSDAIDLGQSQRPQLVTSSNGGSVRESFQNALNSGLGIIVCPD